MRQRLVVLSALLVIGLSTLGFVYTQTESHEPTTTTVRVLVPVNQIQGDMVAATLGGLPIMECEPLINMFGLYMDMGTVAGTVPCDLVVELDP